MSRQSCDQYKLPSGIIVNAPQSVIEEVIKDGGVLWNGYDYQRQFWVFHGERDTRTLEELRSAMV